MITVARKRVMAKVLPQRTVIKDCVLACVYNYASLIIEESPKRNINIDLGWPETNGNVVPRGRGLLEKLIHMSRLFLRSSKRLLVAIDQR